METHDPPKDETREHFLVNVNCGNWGGVRTPVVSEIPGVKIAVESTFWVAFVTDRETPANSFEVRNDTRGFVIMVAERKIREILAREIAEAK